jgi:hypothetical protein
MFHLVHVPDHHLSMDQKAGVDLQSTHNSLPLDMVKDQRLRVRQRDDMGETVRTMKLQPHQVHLMPQGSIHLVLTKSMQRRLKALDQIMHRH